MALALHRSGGFRFARRAGGRARHHDAGHLRHHADVGGLVNFARAAGLPLVGVDNGPGAVPLETHDLPRECVLVLGQESTGLTPEAQAACSVVLSIAQAGSTRSLNAGAAGAIALHAWVRRHVFGQVPPGT